MPKNKPACVKAHVTAHVKSTIVKWCENYGISESAFLNEAIYEKLQKPNIKAKVK